MSGAKKSVTDPLSGEMMRSGDEPVGPYDAVSAVGFRIFTMCFLRVAFDGHVYNGEADCDRATKSLTEGKAV